jgi:hypothetical protein
MGRRVSPVARCRGQAGLRQFSHLGPAWTRRVRSGRVFLLGHQKRKKENRILFLPQKQKLYCRKKDEREKRERKEKLSMCGWPQLSKSRHRSLALRCSPCHKVRSTAQTILCHRDGGFGTSCSIFLAACLFLTRFNCFPSLRWDFCHVRRNALAGAGSCSRKLECSEREKSPIRQAMRTDGVAKEGCKGKEAMSGGAQRKKVPRNATVWWPLEREFRYCTRQIWWRLTVASLA